MRRPILVLVIAVLALAVAGGLVWRHLGSELRVAGPSKADQLFEVPAGATRRQVLDALVRAGALQDARTAELTLRAAGLDPVFKAGRYRITAGASLQDLVERLSSGQVEMESLTIPEGWTFAQARAAIEAHPAIEATLRGRDESELLAAAGAAPGSAEGRLFPDTYRFAAGTRDVQLYRQGFERLRSVLDAAWDARAPDLPLSDKQQALVLASLVEKETGIAEERPLIAAVFVNRLRLGMRLQSDPTVIYGLGSNYDGNIRKRDLTTDTPYNTYTRAGLPPTPIALVGREAIEATLRPAQSDALYFVATGRGDGRHEFNRDYPAHQRAVETMLRNQRSASSVGGAR
jgi:UPF0755 protein